DLRALLEPAGFGQWGIDRDGPDRKALEGEGRGTFGRRLRRGFGHTLTSFRDTRRRSPGQEHCDLAQSLERAKLLRSDWQGFGDPLLDPGEDLDSLDRIDPEVRVQPHVEVEHLDGIPRLLGDHFEDDGTPRVEPSGLEDGGPRAVSVQEAEDL